MKKRSFLAALLAATMLLLSLAACTPETPSGSTSEPEGSESTTQQPEPEINWLSPELPPLPEASSGNIAAPFDVPKKPTLQAIKIAAADSSIKKNGAKLLSDNTSLLIASGNSITFKVTAEEAGLYGIDLDYNIGGGYLHYLYVYNDSASTWGGHGEGRLGTSANRPATGITDEDYKVSNDKLMQKHDGKYEASVYLQKGENTLRMTIGGGSLNTKLAFSEIRIIPDIIYLANTYTTLYTVRDFKAPSGYQHKVTSDSNLSNNGYFLRPGSTVFMEVEVAEDGVYALSGFVSSQGATLTVSSPEGSFTPASATVPTLKLGDCSTSVIPTAICELELGKGKHILQLDIAGNWFHYNLLALEKVANIAEGLSLSSTRENFACDRETGEFSFDLSILARDNANTETKLTVIFLGSIITNENERITIDETYSLTGGMNTLKIASKAYESFRTGQFSVRIFNANDNSFVEEAAGFTVRSTDEFAAYIVTDTHYTGTNEAFEIYNYTSGSYVNGTGGVKKYNGYTAEYDNYGWTSDEKVQRLIDDMLMRYKTGEIDMVLILGDAAMNDGNYHNFAQDHVRYHTGLAYLQNGDLLPPGTQIPAGTPTQEPSTHYGQSIADFWDHPLNVSYMYREKFMTQLAAAGVPYYLANGNHDYEYYYNEDKTGIDYTPWEEMYHYAELFGHKNDKGEYTDATPVDYLVRVIRRDGEVKILSALSSAELAAFKERNKNDGNCYDFYVSEDTLTASDKLVTAFMMVNPHQIDGYDNYMKLYITYDIATKEYNYHWQTLRASFYPEDILNGMGELGRDFSNVWVVSHLISATSELTRVIDKFENIRGSIYGDVHTEEYHDQRGGEPSWVAGYYSHSYDIDFYYVRDPATGEYLLDSKGNKVPDNQYYYDRGNPKLAHRIWGDTMRHPFNHIILRVEDSMAYIEREHQAVYYANDWQERLTYDWVRGWDPDYMRATDTERPAGSSFRDGNRTVYVGGDVAKVGDTMAYVGRSYEKNHYNKNEYILKPNGGTSYTVYDLAGNDIGDTVTLSSFEEGTSFSYKNETYYVLSKIGGVSGHYLYDENGDYVYRTASGKLVYYDFIRDQNGDLVKEYFYMNNKDEFVALGEWQNGEYILKDGVYTDIRFYKAGIDHERQANGKWNVTSGKIEIENGVIVRGEGFTGFGYAYNFVDGQGNPVPKSRVMTASDGLGYYVPRENYFGKWILFK